MAWVRLFGLVFGSSVYSFSAVLGIYLLGIAVGAALVGPRLGRIGTLAGFGALQLVLAATAALAIQAFPGLPQRMLDMGTSAGADWRGLLLAEVSTVALLIGAPCVILGAIFPVATRLLQSRDGGHAAGLAYAVNTAGTIAGSLVAGFRTRALARHPGHAPDRRGARRRDRRDGAAARRAPSRAQGHGGHDRRAGGVRHRAVRVDRAGVGAHAHDVRCVPTVAGGEGERVRRRRGGRRPPRHCE
jgi:hypothetical protein